MFHLLGWIIVLLLIFIAVMLIYRLIGSNKIGSPRLSNVIEKNTGKLAILAQELVKGNFRRISKNLIPNDNIYKLLNGVFEILCEQFSPASVYEQETERIIAFGENELEVAINNAQKQGDENVIAYCQELRRALETLKVAAENKSIGISELGVKINSIIEDARKIATWRESGEGRGEERAETKKNFYEILGVTPDVSDDEIRSAYRTLISQYHPDKFANAPKEFQELANKLALEITEAYGVLSNSKKRKEYDEILKSAR